MKKTISFSIFLCCIFWASMLALAQEPSITRVLMTSVTVGKDEAANCARASELAQNAGFPLQFEVHVNAQEQYYQTLEEKLINASEGQNSVVICRGKAIQAWEDHGLLQHKEGSPYIQLGDYRAINRLAVLVHADTFDAFQPSLETADDLEDFLYTLQDWHPDQVPCATTSFIADRMYPNSGFTALSLFLPQEGYVCLSDAFKGIVSGLNCWLSLKDGIVSDAYSLKESREAVTRYFQWIDQGLLTPYVTRNAPDLSNYPVLLVNTEDFMNPLMLANNPAYAALPLDEYLLFVLYPDLIPNFSWPGIDLNAYYACAASGTDLGVFLDFLDWLQVEENYYYFLYGIEDYDPIRTGDQFAVNESNLSYVAWEQRVFFLSQKYEAGLKRQNRPGNYQQAMRTIEMTPIECVHQDSAEQVQTVLSEDYYETIVKCTDGFRSELERSTQLAGANRQDQIETIFSNPIYQGMDPVVDFLNEYINTY